MKQYFVRYQFGGGKQPKHNITVTAKSKATAYKQARLSLPKHIITDPCFKFVDCVELQAEKKTTKKYIISPITTFDEDDQLYYTKVGTEGKEMPLHFIAVGKTEDESKYRAAKIVHEIETALLNNYRLSLI